MTRFFLLTALVAVLGLGCNTDSGDEAIDTVTGEDTGARNDTGSENDDTGEPEPDTMHMLDTGEPEPDTMHMLDTGSCNEIEWERPEPPEDDTEQDTTQDTGAMPPIGVGLVLPEWVGFAGGPFQMGSPDGVGYDNEHPQREVTVPAFEIMKTEVTVGMYNECVTTGPCDAPSDCNTNFYGNTFWEYGYEDYPVGCIDWAMAKAFCEWVDVDGRLPTEAEWEYAALSGGKDIRYPWGYTEASCVYASMMTPAPGEWSCTTRASTPVCSKPCGQSAQGICDLAGNHAEWVQDSYHYNYELAPTDGSAWEDTDAPFRVLRGGSWANYPGMVRSRARGYDVPTQADLSISQGPIGFRCAR